MTTANVYIDGFNLYYCALKNNSACKWLDLRTFANTLFPKLTISKIKYFSAKVKAYSWDMNAPTRQGFYWRALQTIPNLEIIEGNFVERTKTFPAVPYVFPGGNPLNPPQTVRVLKREEKGSDVNLASHLLFDNCAKDADESLVISNDADLVTPIELVSKKLNRRITVVNPNRTSDVRKDPLHHALHRELKRVATCVYPSVNDHIFQISQFPISLSDSKGIFTKPSTWV
jgi:hypothetical protein